MTTPPPAVPVALHGAEHAANPQGSWAALRLHGPVGIAEIDPGVYVHVVTDPRAALDLLQDTSGIWSKDSRHWMRHVPPNSPIRPNVQWRHSLFFTDGAEHSHLRRVITDSLDLLDPRHVRDATLRFADQLLNRFAPTGEADLVGQYAEMLPPMILNALFGAPDEQAPQLHAVLKALMSTDLKTKADGEKELAVYLSTLIASKLARRGQDLISWFLVHPNGLTPENVGEQAVIAAGASFPTLTGLMSNATKLVLSDSRYRGTLTTGTLTVKAAIDEALWNDPPLAMNSLHFPRVDVELHGTLIKAGSPVMVSYAAVNTCPYSGRPADGRRSGNRAHLAFAAGPHACPARKTALLIAATAIERLISYLPDITLAVPRDQLRYHTGPFYRFPAALPCRFTPLALTTPSPAPRTRTAAPGAATATA
ncbi:cytochrome P450 family protein [Streptomyces acidiscabies]|uniref:Cytochrome P450 n=1 Tax=Streptomyces acidiscabies TaxID=42234 RepID=A0ABU4MBL4_9ACTN|nr:cytochrome P450 [Streptomyces acidiscabies]MDX3024942.1 cytochrome P450 [Streptomyces acidiscabies]